LAHAQRRSSGVDLVELAFGPGDRILRGYALDRLGIHVDEQVEVIETWVAQFGPQRRALEPPPS
jgi:hypothetical protein